MEIRALLSAMAASKIGPLLVAAQVAVSLAVIVNLTYVIEQRLAAAERPTGLDLRDMFWVRTQPSSPDYNYAAAVKADLAYLNALPGCIAATAADPLPQTLSSFRFALTLRPPGAAGPVGGVDANMYLGTERFIQAMGLRLIAGRNFSPDSVTGPEPDMMTVFSHWAPEVIVTRSLASRLFPGGHALGKTVYLMDKPAVIVGIVGLMRANPLPPLEDLLATQVAIVPMIPPGPDGTYVVRTQPGRRDELMARIGKEFAGLQPGRFISRMEAYDTTAAQVRQGDRASALILGTVAITVLLVTVVGILGLAAFNVVTRTKQLGIRRALGARRFHILRYFLVESWITMTAGVSVGCILAVAAGVEVSRVYQLARLPLYYLAGGVLLMWAVGLIAVLVPALRAASVSPAVATRTV